MLRLSFPVFWAKKEQDTHRFTTLHCLEEPDKFTFVFKSREEWEYYTVIIRADIIAFSEYSGMDIDQTIEQFRINYCSNTLPLEPEDTKAISESELTEPIEEEDLSEDDEDDYKALFKDLIIEAGEEIVDESKDYGEFLTNLFNDMERRVLLAVDKIGLDKSYIVDKNFGEFMRNLFNVVNTATFAKHIKRFIKADLVTGLVSAESELKVDIGFTDAYQDKLNVLSQEQLSGRTINGKKWFGIRGTTKQLQAEIIATVQSGIVEHKTINEIKDAIKENFDGFSDFRAQLISRTESNRVLNSAKLLGYAESGIEGGKVWKTSLDNRTSPICRRLHAKYGNNPIPLDDMFIDDETMQEFTTAPAHIQCRSTLSFRPK